MPSDWMDCGEAWDDWEPLPESVIQRPAPSGFTTCSRAVSGVRPAAPVGRRPLKVPPLPVENWKPPANKVTSENVAEITQNRVEQDHAGAANKRTADPANHGQQPPLPRHRTIIDFARSKFNPYVAPWIRHQQLDPDELTESNFVGRGTVGSAAARSTVPVALTSGKLEQLKSILCNLQSSLRDGSGTLTGRDREDLWWLSCSCWDAASASAQAADTVLGAAEQSRVLQLIASGFYDVANEQAALSDPSGQAANHDGGDTGRGWGGKALFERVEFFLKMGRTWQVVGNLDQAGWHLARAREGLVQLAADDRSEMPHSKAAYGAQSRKQGLMSAKTPQACQKDEEGHLSDMLEAQEEVAEGGGDGCEGGSGPWVGLGVSAAEYLAVEARVLLESLRLAMAEGHKALSANLHLQLLRLLCAHHTPAEVRVPCALDCVAALMDAAAAKLEVAHPPREELAAQQQAADPRVRRVPGLTHAACDSVVTADSNGVAAALNSESQDKGLGPSGTQRAAQQPLDPRQRAAMAEGLALLSDSALSLLERVLEGGEVEGPAGGRGGVEEGGLPPRRMTRKQMEELVRMRQQVLKVLISGNMRMASYGSALSYIREYERSLDPSPAAAAGAPQEAAGSGKPNGVAATRRLRPAVLPLNLLLLSLQAFLGLGKVAEAVAVVARDVEPHPSCTPAVIKAAFSRVLDVPLEQFSVTMPGITACLLVCLERCQQHHNAVGREGGQGAACWPPSAGPELVLLVASAVASHEGLIAEQHLLTLLAHDDIVAAMSNDADPRARLHRLLFARAAAAYQQADTPAAARLFTAALLYASGGAGAPYCRTARMLSNCYVAMGQLGRALGYLDLAEAHEPDTVAQVLLRLRLVLGMQNESRGSNGVNAAAAWDGTVGRGPATGTAAHSVAPSAVWGLNAPRKGGSGGGGEAEFATAENELAMRLVAQLPRCCDFETSHLTVAYDLAMRARRYGIAVAAAQLSRQALKPGTPSADTSALQAAISLTRDGLLARLSVLSSWQRESGKTPANRPAAEGSSMRGQQPGGTGDDEGDDVPLPCDIAQAVVHDLRWLREHLEAGASTSAALGVQSRKTLAWLRDLALRLTYEALGNISPSSECPSRPQHALNSLHEDVPDAGDMNGDEPPNQHYPQRRQRKNSGRDWRMAATALACARQLDATILAMGSDRGVALAASGQADCSLVGRLPVQPALIAVAASMLEAYAAGDVSDSSLIESARKLLDSCQLQPPCAQRPSGSSGAVNQTPAGTEMAGGAAWLRATVLQLRFVTATFQRDEVRQKATLQALVGDPAVVAANLEALAELCLAPGRPWHCAPMACGLLGFAMRKALAAVPSAGSRDAPQPAREVPGGRVDVGVVARAIRRLFLLGSPEVRLRVCDKAAEVAMQMTTERRQADSHRVDIGSSNGDGDGEGGEVNTTSAAISQYPVSELQYLWASCYNAAVAEGLLGTGSIDSSSGPCTVAATAAALASSRSQRLLGMAGKLAMLTNGDACGADEESVVGCGAMRGTELPSCLTQAYNRIIHTGRERGPLKTAPTSPPAVVPQTNLPLPPSAPAVRPQQHPHPQPRTVEQPADIPAAPTPPRKPSPPPAAAAPPALHQPDGASPPAEQTRMRRPHLSRARPAVPAAHVRDTTQQVGTVLPQRQGQGDMPSTQGTLAAGHAHGQDPAGPAAGAAPEAASAPLLDERTDDLAAGITTPNRTAATAVQLVQVRQSMHSNAANAMATGVPEVGAPQSIATRRDEDEISAGIESSGLASPADKSAGGHEESSPSATRAPDSRCGTHVEVLSEESSERVGNTQAPTPENGSEADLCAGEPLTDAPPISHGKSGEECGDEGQGHPARDEMDVEATTASDTDCVDYPASNQDCMMSGADEAAAAAVAEDPSQGTLTLQDVADVPVLDGEGGSEGMQGAMAIVEEPEASQVQTGTQTGAQPPLPSSALDATHGMFPTSQHGEGEAAVPSSRDGAGRGSSDCDADDDCHDGAIKDAGRHLAPSAATVFAVHDPTPNGSCAPLVNDARDRREGCAHAEGKEQQGDPPGGHPSPVPSEQVIQSPHSRPTGAASMTATCLLPQQQGIQIGAPQQPSGSCICDLPKTEQDERALIVQHEQHGPKDLCVQVETMGSPGGSGLAAHGQDQPFSVSDGDGRSAVAGQPFTTTETQIICDYAHTTAPQPEGCLAPVASQQQKVCNALHSQGPSLATACTQPPTSPTDGVSAPQAEVEARCVDHNTADAAVAAAAIGGPNGACSVPDCGPGERLEAADRGCQDMERIAALPVLCQIGANPPCGVAWQGTMSPEVAVGLEVMDVLRLKEKEGSRAGQQQVAATQHTAPAGGDWASQRHMAVSLELVDQEGDEATAWGTTGPETQQGQVSLFQHETAQMLLGCHFAQVAMLTAMTHDTAILMGPASDIAALSVAEARPAATVVSVGGVSDLELEDDADNRPVKRAKLSELDPPTVVSRPPACVALGAAEMEEKGEVAAGASSLAKGTAVASDSAVGSAISGVATGASAPAAVAAGADAPWPELDAAFVSEYADGVDALMLDDW